MDTLKFLKIFFKVISFHIIAWVYVFLVLTKEGRNRMSLVVTVALNMLK
jgi:hypothetical protein